MNKSTQKILENDPIEEIFALNMGDFLTEHLISDELLGKINVSVKDKITGLKNQLKELISIYSLDKTLTLLGFNSEDDFIIYNSIAKTITQMLEVNSCHIFLESEHVKALDKKSKNELFLVGSSFDDNFEIQSKKITLPLNEDENIITKSFLERKTINIKNVREIKNWKPIYELKQDKTVSLLVVPMASNAGNVGVICIEIHEEKDIIPEFINLIESTSRLFVTSMKLQKLVEETTLAINDPSPSPIELRHLRTELTAIIGDLGDEQQIFVEAIATAADAKGQYKKTHSGKVANLAREICEYLKLNEKTTDLIYYAGLLQNIGKITLPQEIFSKKEKLSKDDWTKLQNHPNVGVSVLMKINFLSEVVPYIHYHRERWDGHGEPEGLSGISIPFGSRIIAVADAYMALTSDRPYRKAMPAEKALIIMKEEAGTKWDPYVIDALTAIKE